MPENNFETILAPPPGQSNEKEKRIKDTLFTIDTKAPQQNPCAPEMAIASALSLQAVQPLVVVIHATYIFIYRQKLD